MSKLSALGKFEGEPGWVSLLWDRVLSGFSDDSVYDGSLSYEGFRIDADIAELTGYSEDIGRYIVLWENDQGFVSHSTLSEKEFQDMEGFDLEEPTGDWLPGVDPDFDELGETGW